jgi:2-dehydropantoate 2-reductase
MIPARVVVLGAGAIGASVGALLFEVGVPCVLVARGEHGRAMARGGVHLRFPDRAQCIRVPTVETIEEAAVTHEDLVIVATMGQHTADAVAPLDKRVAVASFQNGLSPIDALRGRPLMVAVVFVPAERREPGIVALPAVPTIGTILLGDWPRGVVASTEWVVARLAEAGFHAEVEADIAPWVRAKLLTNLAGIVVALCDDPPVDVIEAAQAEACAVWRANGEPFESVEALMQRVGARTLLPVDGRARKGGSTRAALARGDRLETADLHGSIVAAGRAALVPTPVNDALIRLARAAEEGRWGAGAMTPGELRTRVE